MLHRSLIYSIFLILIGFSSINGIKASQSFTKCRTGSYLDESLKTSRYVVASRPNLPNSRISSSGRFEVHFTLTGIDATSEVFVDSALSILDFLWLFEIDSLNYREPPSEYDGRIHLYIHNLGTYYGATYPSTNHGVDVTSYMECDNDFAESVYSTHGLNALRVTLAHEFMHVIQFGYRVDPVQLALYEWFSTWMEDAAYDNVNDYIYYLADIFENPESSLFTFNGSREYAACLFVHLLDQKFGRDIIRITWENFEDGGGSLFENVLGVLHQDGISEEELAGNYLAWCYMTGSRSINNFGFKDALFYDEIDPIDLLPWETNHSQYTGKWGFYCTDIHGGIQGDPGVEVFPHEETVHVAGVYEDSGVDYTIGNPGNELFGARAFAGAVNIDNEPRDLRLKVVPERIGLPAYLEIKPPYPNPFNNSVSWTIRTDKPTELQFEIFDILGRMVLRDNIYTGIIPEITYRWSGVNGMGAKCSSGLYILSVKTGTLESAKRVLYIR